MKKIILSILDTVFDEHVVPGIILVAIAVSVMGIILCGFVLWVLPK